MSTWQFIEKLVDHIDRHGPIPFHVVVRVVGQHHVAAMLAGIVNETFPEGGVVAAGTEIVIETGGPLLSAKRNSDLRQGQPVCVYDISDTARPWVVKIREKAAGERAALDQRELKNLRSREQFLRRGLHQAPAVDGGVDERLLTLARAIVDGEVVEIYNDTLDALYCLYS